MTSGGGHGSSDRTVPEDPAWWQRGIVYQVYPWSFADASGDGVGDLEGIRRRAEYLQWLGIDAVWMSPIFATPGADLGYDISDYRRVDPRFGSLADLDRLVDELHGRGIRLVLDLVPNHTSNRHPWFLESRSDRGARRHDWYVWRDGAPDGPPPNNWESYFGGPAWTYLDPPGRWYLHSFDRGQPDLNWEHPDVRAAMVHVMRFWLDRGVDGFRVDVLWLLGKDPELRDNPPNPDWQEGLPAYLRLLRVHSEDGPRAHEFARLLRTVVDEYPERVMIGEVVLPAERAVAFYGAELPEAHLPHNFTLTQMREWTAESVRVAVEHYEGVLPDGAWPNWLLGDHDFPRIASRLGPERSRLATMLLLTLRGTPTWYYGDEIGMIDAVFERPLGVSDPQAGTGAERDRLVARTPMQWSTERNAGFSTAEPWLPIASDDPALTVQRQRDDPDSVLSLFRALVRARREIPALAVGTYASLPAPPGVFSFERGHPAGTVWVHLNFGDRPAEVELSGPGEVAVSTDARRAGERVTGRVTLRASEGLVVRPA